MKLILFAFVSFLSFSISGYAQTTEEKAVAAAVEKLKTGMVNSDEKILNNIAAPELTYGHSSGKVEDKAAFVKAFVSGETDFVKIDLTDQTVKVVGNTALVRHTLAAETKNGGVPGTTKLAILLVWQKQQGQWKLLARQAVKV